MTTALWTKISLGAAGVFATGMLGITAFRHAKVATEHAVAHAVTGAVREASASVNQHRDFVFDGATVGRMSAFTLKRAGYGQLLDAALDVDLTDGAATARLARCELTPAGSNARGTGNDFDIDEGFRCAVAADEPVVTVGRVHFTPGGFDRPIVVSRRHEAELRQGEPFEVEGTTDGMVHVTARDAKGSLVKIRADSTGAAINVNDELGRQLVRLFADSTGASLRVRDEQGREVVRLEAGAGGLTIKVDTSAGH